MSAVCMTFINPDHKKKQYTFYLATAMINLTWYEMSADCINFIKLDHNKTYALYIVTNMIYFKPMWHDSRLYKLHLSGLKNNLMP